VFLLSPQPSTCFFGFCKRPLTWAFSFFIKDKKLLGVFELPLLKNAQKHHKRKQARKYKKGTYLSHLLAIC
jgi:hypothetical protein